MDRAFESVGDVTVTPDDNSVVVGDFSLREGDDTIWVEVQRTSPDQGWPWSYGILSWRSSFGDELGSVKAYTTREGEIVRLGVGRTPRTLTGRFIYQPRSFNLAWVRRGYALSLSFAATSGVSNQVLSEAGSSVAFPVVGGNWRYAPDSGLLRLDL